MLAHSDKLRGGVARRARLALAAAGCALVVGGPLAAQTHKVAKPENVVRAVGVYEWTGDMAKPTAMRLIPISLFIDGHFEDAGVYLARPVPFALLTGNEYEVEQAGVPKGLVELSFSRRFEPVDSASVTPYDDGWFGYGKFVPPAPPRKSTLQPSRNLAKINGLDEDDDRPHFSSRSATPGSGGSASNVPAAGSGSPASDPDRPTLHRGSGSSAGGTPTETAGNNPPADPDRPTLHRGSDSSGTDSDTTIADPSDRPTLRRRSPSQAAEAKSEHDGITDTPSLNADPDRPRLVRGKPVTPITEADFPKLSGLPGEQDLHQMVAVSDAANRPVHDFARAWDDDSDRVAILGKMETAAEAQLAAYETANAEKPRSTAPPPGDARHPNSKLRHGVTPDTKPAAASEGTQGGAPEKLVDEQLKAYTLSYGAPATYVYTAHTDGLGVTLRYVTLVAETDMQGNLRFAIQSVTDASHLDRTARMRLIDAVDADASNRASLLFELRSQGARQFALYRVIGAHADQIFLTGTTQ